MKICAKIAIAVFVLFGFLYPNNTTAVVIKSSHLKCCTFDTDSLYFNILKHGACSTIDIAKLFLESPYVAGVLDRNTEEQLVINTKELDCVTFVENVLAARFSVKDSIPKNNVLFYKAFESNLKSIRYRNACIDGYTSRLHYATDWLKNICDAGFMTNITKDLGGISLQPNIFFMSKNYDKYPALKVDTSAVRKIIEVENLLSSDCIYYIPKEEVSRCEKGIKSGDVVLITTSIPGLDTSHMGLAIVKNGRVYLMHASSVTKKVVVTVSPLSDYLSKNKLQTGIIVARPI